MKGTDVVVRVFTLEPGNRIPWHYHSESLDHYFVLEGNVSIETRGAEPDVSLNVGDRYKIEPGIAHTVANTSTATSRFLLVQGVGQYDWLKA
ncbi:cupin domain-containing protein [Tardiphaga sp. 709]|uniref:cupin domain-containing protein n=1 Tax=Tardiphaga sp. 709 TaxID=3076039 RepID=UPI0028EE08B5|nr:cupin domain-containing protein [Tardiphaga sp. 709]WNV11779.1 cupin domain-containing protein [Tardiphaga sp. 709]